MKRELKDRALDEHGESTGPNLMKRELKAARALKSLSFASPRESHEERIESLFEGEGPYPKGARPESHEERIESFFTT